MDLLNDIPEKSGTNGVHIFLGEYVKSDSRVVRSSAFLTVLVLSAVVFFAPGPVTAQVTAFKQAVSEAASRDKDIAAFYQSNGYKPVWTGAGEADRARRAELIRAIDSAASHG